MYCKDNFPEPVGWDPCPQVQHFNEPTASLVGMGWECAMGGEE